MKTQATKQQQNFLFKMYMHSIERPQTIGKKIDEIFGRKHLKHIPWAYEISLDEAKLLFSEMEIYRDYHNGAQGLVLSMEELEEEPDIPYCVEINALMNWKPFSNTGEQK
ncbi:MAG: hypothetical protein WC656_01415 [Sulfurimonas sp.]|jgi:hypothetical protein